MSSVNKKKYTPALSTLGKLSTPFGMMGSSRLLQINVGGNDLIKNLYYNSTGSVRTGDSQTQPFQYARDVLLGCILSPRLFNLYINNLPCKYL